MARAPSDAEFSKFVQAVWPGMFLSAYLMLGDRGLAEDLVQTSPARPYASWPRVREVDTAPAYARKIMANTAASWFRKKGWRNERPTEELPERATDHDPTQRLAVIEAVQALPARQRAVIVLRFLEELSVAETARSLGISDGTVKSQTSDALSSLRLLVADHSSSLTQHPLGGHHD